MLDSILENSLLLNSIFDELGFTLITYGICIGTSLILGLATALLCMYKNSYTQSFIITLTILPSVVASIIVLVNGNIGAGVAVAGAFSLVRFRSMPGTAKEIGMIFLAMAIGLACGMGNVVLAVIFFAAMSLFTLLLTGIRFGAGREDIRELKITIAENLDFDSLFDDVLMKYTNTSKLMRVKTTNMGTLYELNYQITLKDEKLLKEFMDELRCRNGNLNLVCGRPADKETL